MWPCVPSLLCRVILTARTATTFSSKGILNELRLGRARVRETGRLAPLQTCGPSLSRGRAPGQHPQAANPRAAGHRGARPRDTGPDGSRAPATARPSRSPRPSQPSGPNPLCRRDEKKKDALQNQNFYSEQAFARGRPRPREGRAPARPEGVKSDCK